MRERKRNLISAIVAIIVGISFLLVFGIQGYAVRGFFLGIVFAVMVYIALMFDIIVKSIKKVLENEQTRKESKGS